MPVARSLDHELLDLLLADGPRSRAELGRLLGVSRATVTTQLKRLEAAGMLTQQPLDQRSGIGRPPLRVRLADDAAYALGVEFALARVNAVLCDVRGTAVASAGVDCDAAAVR